MDKYALLAERIKGITAIKTLPSLFAAEVTEITGDTCSVMVGDLELTDVRLKASIGEGEDRTLLIPKKGSTVLISSLTGDYKDLSVLKIDQIEKIDYRQNGLNVLIDATDGKVSISNKNASWYGIMKSLASLLKAFKVTTPSGASKSVLPDTFNAITDFENDINSLFK